MRCVFFEECIVSSNAKEVRFVFKGLKLISIV